MKNMRVYILVFFVLAVLVLSVGCNQNKVESTPPLKSETVETLKEESITETVTETFLNEDDLEFITVPLTTSVSEDLTEAEISETTEAVTTEQGKIELPFVPVD